MLEGFKELFHYEYILNWKTAQNICLLFNFIVYCYKKYLMPFSEYKSNSNNHHYINKH